jgi:guanidinopropionase
MEGLATVEKDGFFRPVPGFDLPRFAGIPTFMRLPHVPFDHPRFAEVQIGLIGAPWDGGTTNRPGPRHGPRQLRDLSTMIRAQNGATWVAPFEIARCADLGDVAPNPGDLMDSMARMEAFYTRVVADGGGRSSLHPANLAGRGQETPGRDDSVRQPY